MSARELFKSIAKFGLITGAFAAIVGLSAFAVIQVVMRTGSVVEVPNVVGEGFYTASKRLGEIGLRIHVEEEVFSPVVPGDHITYQRPVAGARVKTGRVVLVHVSQGSKKISQWKKAETINNNQPPCPAMIFLPKPSRTSAQLVYMRVLISWLPSAITSL